MGPQTQHINNKLAKNIAIINKLRYFVDLHTLKQLYYSFIYPYLTYATIAWGSACKTNLRKILIKQNKNVREACSLPIAKIVLHHITIF